MGRLRLVLGSPMPSTRRRRGAYLPFQCLGSAQLLASSRFQFDLKFTRAGTVSQSSNPIGALCARLVAKRAPTAAVQITGKMVPAVHRYGG